LFEIGNIFVPPEATEKRAIGFVFSGATSTQPHWRAKEKRPLDFFDLKGAIDELRIPDLTFRRSEDEGLALAAEILSGDEVIGLVGQLRAGQVFVAQILLDPIRLTSDAKRFEEIERFPAITRDIAMIVPAALRQEDIIREIRAAKEALLADVRLFDVFEGSDGGNVAAGRKSLAYTLTYRDRNRTLTADEIAAVHTRIRERLKRELGAELRE
jgi:phenylalanyl-tRNA synthetase beta chain